MNLSAVHAAPGGFFMLKSDQRESVDWWLDLQQKLDRGRGYFKLRMYDDAARHLEDALRLCPELHAARLLLAAARLRLSDWIGARRHFQLIAVLAENPKWQAAAYNGLGCVQAVQSQLEQAKSCFRRALEADPSCEDAMYNLQACLGARGRIRLRFGAGEVEAAVPRDAAGADRESAGKGAR